MITIFKQITYKHVFAAVIQYCFSLVFKPTPTFSLILWLQITLHVLHIMHYTLCTTHYTLHMMHYTLRTAHYALHITHYILCTRHYTSCITHYTLHITPYMYISQTGQDCAKNSVLVLMPELSTLKQRVDNPGFVE